MFPLNPWRDLVEGLTNETSCGLKVVRCGYSLGGPRARLGSFPYAVYLEVLCKIIVRDDG